MVKTLVLLTFNEIEGIKALYGRIPFDCAHEVVAVDGGSTDGTREFLREKNIRILNQEERGRGSAFRVALNNTSGDVLLFFSPDGNEDPADIPNLFRKIEEGCDLAIASRFARGSRNEEDGEIFPMRAIVNRTFTFMANVVWNRGKYVTDTINGFRAITRKALERLHTTSRRFTIEYQISIRSMKLGLNIGELPTSEGNRIGGESKAISLPVGLEHLWLFFDELISGTGFERIPETDMEKVV